MHMQSPAGTVQSPGGTVQSPTGAMKSPAMFWLCRAQNAGRKEHGLLDHGGWTRLVFRYQRSSLENQFEPTHVGCHLISALVLCVWRPDVGCSLLDVGCFRLPRSVLRSALCALRF